ncbi:uncharacterized protein LOC114533381 [Dendronephthya gigantea]|uniref:uncharacterized protein LOC114533381 n=1 Tax=Dendronephthya gigantea TaxID=151771 RepID=UPI00106CFFFA|nr:uncharacterized protein LOC114533381 [Dendronephthya gigantea]
MIATLCYGFSILVINPILLVELCSPTSPKPKGSVPSSPQISPTGSPTTKSHKPAREVIQRKEMMLVPVKGYRLDKSSYVEMPVISILDCAHFCLAENGLCRSINFEKKQTTDGHNCQLNNSTKDNNAKNFVQSSLYNYFEPKQAMLNGKPVGMEEIEKIRNGEL